MNISHTVHRLCYNHVQFRYVIHAPLYTETEYENVGEYIIYTKSESQRAGGAAVFMYMHALQHSQVSSLEGDQVNREHCL